LPPQYPSLSTGEHKKQPRVQANPIKKVSCFRSGGDHHHNPKKHGTLALNTASLIFDLPRHRGWVMHWQTGWNREMLESSSMLFALAWWRRVVRKGGKGQSERDIGV